MRIRRPCTRRLLPLRHLHKIQCGFIVFSKAKLTFFVFSIIFCRKCAKTLGPSGHSGVVTFLCTSWLGHSTPAAAPRVPRLVHSTPAAATRMPRLAHSTPAAAPRVPRLVHSTPAAATRMPRRARPDAPASSLQGGGGRYAFLKNPGEQVKHYSFFA